MLLSNNYPFIPISLHLYLFFLLFVGEFFCSFFFSCRFFSFSFIYLFFFLCFFFLFSIIIIIIFSFLFFFLFFLSSQCAAITEVGGAVAGDRTMLDALLPAVGALNRGVQRKITLNSAMRTAAAAAEGGALATASLVPKRGRARYVGERCLGTKDGGAVAVALALRAVCLPETDQPVCDHTSHDHTHGHGK